MKFFINSWYLVQGTIAQVAYHILDERGTPYDTAGATEARLEVKNADGSVLSVVATGGITIGLHSPVTIWIWNLTVDQIAALPIGRMDAFVRCIYSDSERIFSYPASLSISKKPI